MYWYALIGMIATVVLVIENYDILFYSGSQEFPHLRIYRRLLYGILAYYFTDTLWGILDSLHHTTLLFVDTVVYYVAMAAGVLWWTQYVVVYLAEDNAFSRFLSRTGRVFFAFVVTVAVINFFTPVLFWFDENGIYHACPVRHVQLLFQIFLLLLTSIYTYRAMLQANGAVRNRYMAIFLFGLVMSILLFVQLDFPLLPLYTLGYLLGACLLHTFVVRDEMEEYRDELLASQQKTREQEQMSQAKSAFLANMSHEIRTPINAVLGMNEMILRESTEQNVIEYAENIHTAGNTLLSLVNDILDFSKIEAGKMEIIPVDYDISSLINDLVNMIQARADDKGLLLKPDFDENIPRWLFGDEVRIKQVVTNILTNAVKYTKEGSVTFHIGYEKIPDDPGGVFLDFSVSDTGIGIKPEDMAKLFSEFERIEEKRNRNIEGTGLGMNITQRLLEMMESSLKVESVYGQGSTFSFRLRQKVISWEALGNYEAAHRASLSERKKYREKFTAPDATILVVDDTPMNLTVFKGLLKQTKVQIDTADSGDEGLSLAKNKKYDVIFLDLLMPDKDGIETLQELRHAGGVSAGDGRANEENPNRRTPVLCLTANALAGARERYLAKGFSDYLTKPVEGADLEAALIKFLPPEKVHLHEDPEENEATAPEEMSAGGEAAHPCASADTGASCPSQLRAFYAGVPELNYEDAIRFCANEEVLKETLEQFYRAIEPNIQAIEGFLREKDYKNFTVKVHALKSSSRLIGAGALSADAGRLEDLGNSLTQEDIDRIGELTPKLLEDYRRFLKLLSPLYAAEEAAREAAPEISVSDLNEAYDAIRQFIESFDIDTIDGFISEVRKYRIPKAEQAKFTAVEECVRNMDWNGLDEALKGRRYRMSRQSQAK